jgi:hypothetical protein
MESTDRSLIGEGSIVLNKISFDPGLFELGLMIHLRKIPSVILEEFGLNNDDLWEDRGGCEVHGFSSDSLVLECWSPGVLELWIQRN